MPCIDLEIRLQPLSSFHQGCWKGNSDYKRKWSAYYALTLNPNLVCISILRVLIFHVFSLRASCVRFLSGERGTIGGLLELRASLMSLILFVFSLSWCGSTSKYVNVFMMTAASFHRNCGSPNVAVKAHESRLVTFFWGVFDRCQWTNHITRGCCLRQAVVLVENWRIDGLQITCTTQAQCVVAYLRSCTSPYVMSRFSTKTRGKFYDFRSC